MHICSGKLVAIKSFNKIKVNTEKARKKILNETNILKSLNHNNIIKLYETFETEAYIFIIMEYISCGDLLAFVRKRGKLSENVCKFLFRQIIEAIHYMHSMNIIHRDIKLDNILIDLNNNVKLCDFGVSKTIKKDEIIFDQCGTPAYIAPEILENQGYNGFSVDMWSVGVVLYAMLSGTVPFKADNMKALHKMIVNASYDPIPDLSKEAEHLLNRLLELDPSARYTSERVLTHPWLRDYDMTINSKSKQK